MIIIDDNFTNVMLDLETLSTKTNAVITQIGAHVFTGMHENTTFHRHIDIDSCLRKGLVIDGNTLRWWMQQSEEARAGFEKRTITLTGALIAFQSWCWSLHKDSDKPIALWGDGAAFDNAILATAYQRTGYNQPWDFWNDRCFRTVKNQFPEVPKVVPEIAHSALSDAQAQAKHLVNIDAFAHDCSMEPLNAK